MREKKTYFVVIVALFALLSAWQSSGQIVCADVEIVSDPGDRADFVFDSFSKYLSGITFHGIANVNVKVDDQLPANPNCKWMLLMTVENNPSGGTAADEWETLATYGTGTTSPPKIDILDVRITNACSTSPVDGVYQNFNLAGDIIEIIENTGIRINAGSCTTNVNGPGSYLTNYDEFHFQIDFRITPGFTYNPGIYQLQVKFELAEVP
ncbi:MAG: hypothetical protein KDC05_04220 [Bacteroidales bacterium]|nr:hypothetical protein [Bacteroidales bacterium]